MPIQKRVAFIGLAKQTAKGTPAASPVYGFGVLGGGALVAGVEQENDEITYSGDQRISPDENRLGINPGINIRTRCYPRTAGLLLYAALGAIADAGAGPYTHTITPALNLPYLTAWTKFAGEYHQLTDCLINQLTISWTERQPLEVEMELLAIGLTFDVANWVPSLTTDESGASKFGPVGGVFKVDPADGANPAEGKVTGGRISINNNLVPIPLSKSLYPDDLYPGQQEIECEINTMPDDLTLWRKAITGTGAGASVSATPVFGGFDLKCSIDANTYLQLVATKTAFTPDYPEADPGGGPIELVLPGRVKQPTVGDALTVTLKNTVASY